MNSLPLFQIESDLLDTMEVANNYGVGKRAITQHFSRNQDELIKGVHYHLETSPQFKTKVIKWTLEGVYMLGFFVKKSKVAKEYRSKVAKAIAQAREKQLVEAKETRARNLALADKVTELDALLINKTKRHQRQINGYKSQLKQHNNQIIILRHELAKFESIYDSEVVEPKKSDNLFMDIDISDARFKPFDSYHPSYKQLWCEYLGVLASNSGLKLRIKMYQNKKG